MSWQAYVDSSLLGTGKLDHAAIYSRAGDSAWAQSAGFQLSAAEAQFIARGFDDTPAVQGSGVKLGGSKYITLQASDRSIYCRKGQEGLVCVRTKQSILIAHYPDTTQPGEATKIVEQLGDYLISVGY
ncbi:profilin, required for normal timing of actin polymerization in response to thermal stress [Saitoella coloradoensis]